MIFTKSLHSVDASNVEEAIKKMCQHIKYIQEQLEFTLTSLDSNNIIEIDTDKTAIGDSAGSTSIGSYINLTGANGERFTVGKNSKGQFIFDIRGAEGKQTLYLDNDGILRIKDIAELTIDGGEW